MTDPFHIEGPACISFSGGRTSALMLHRIIRAHGGQLPENIAVAFANTGKEREETLRFVYECGVRWGIRIHWLEWSKARPCFEEVGFNSASRAGEPFAALIDKKKRLPNWQERWCTEYLKVRVLNAFCASLGWKAGEYAEVIGLRNDEGHRILRALNNANFKRDRKTKSEVPRVPPRKVSFPLAKAKITKADVTAFWREQPFDLGLEPWEGNCDLCFMKGRAIKKAIIRDDPSRADWWIAQETTERGNGRGWFDRRDRISGLRAEVAANPSFFDEFDPAEYDVECGIACPSEAA
jgi:3'-phosphoadenosine 5'-phosphosulfate sulfotransferase (PAPS reductase)/FAD synthetase